MSVRTLLPPNRSGAYKPALAEAMSDALPVPLSEQMDPYRTDAKNLPHLAAHYSVDLWFDDWPEERKREVIAQYSGQSVLYPGESLPALKGTLEGLRRYLELVDAEIIDRIAYPSRFTFGRARIGRTPVNHEPFLAHYLLKVLLTPAVRPVILGRSAFGSTALTAVDKEPIKRAKRAVIVSKAAATQYTVTFAWRRRLTVSDNVPIDGSTVIGGWIDRAVL